MNMQKYHIVVEADIYRRPGAKYNDVVNSINVHIDNDAENVKMKVFEVFEYDSNGVN